MNHNYWRLCVTATALVAVTAACPVFDGVTNPADFAVVKFTATPSEIPAGSGTTLSWEVNGADSVEINNGVGTVSAKGSKTLHPDWTTAYTLVARRGTSSARR